MSDYDFNRIKQKMNGILLASYKAVVFSVEVLKDLLWRVYSGNVSQRLELPFHELKEDIFLCL